MSTAPNFDAHADRHYPTPNPVAIQPTGRPLGAFVTGIDASLPVDPAALLRLRQAINDHHILIFQGQTLTDDEFLRFATYFGAVFVPPEDVPVLASDAEGKTPDIIPIANVEGGYTGNGELPPYRPPVDALSVQRFPAVCAGSARGRRRHHLDQSGPGLR